MGGRGRPFVRNLSWSKGRGESQGSGWTQGLDNSYHNDFACPSSPCIFGPRKEGGGDAEAAKNRGVPAHSPKAGIRLSVCLPAGLLRDLEEGSRPSLLPTVSGSAFVCLEALRGQEEAAGPGNNGSFSGSPRLPRSDRGRGTVARRWAQPPSAARARPPGDDGVHRWDAGGPSPAHPSSPDPKPGSRPWAERG